MEKVYILDTNVLIQAPYAVECFEDNEVVLPMTVLEELDNLKKEEGEKGANVRKVIRILVQINGFEQKFIEAMDDDLNTADALAAIFDLVRFANAEANTESSRAFIGAVKAEILKLGDVLGLIFEKKEDSLDAEVEKMIEERQEARKAKDYAKADAIRQKLLDMGIELKDTREGVKWNRI